MEYDVPITIDEQIKMMKKYVIFEKSKKMMNFLDYVGYFRASRYAKFLLSYSNKFEGKPSHNILYQLYKFDFELRKILFEYCVKAEVRFKSVLANAVSLKTGDAVFYLDENNYTKSRGERDKSNKYKNIETFNKFIKAIRDKEKELRKNNHKYPELKEYRKGGERENSKIPCWAAFCYFELGSIENIYKFLRSDLRKEVLRYAYTRKKYGKNITKQVDTWINGIRTLRNICAHSSRVVGMKEAIVLRDAEDERDILQNGEDLFSRLYALRKILNKKDGEELKQKIRKLLKNTKLDVYALNILPKEWEIYYDRIKDL